LKTPDYTYGTAADWLPGISSTSVANSMLMMRSKTHWNSWGRATCGLKNIKLKHLIRCENYKMLVLFLYGIIKNQPLSLRRKTLGEISPIIKDVIMLNSRKMLLVLSPYLLMHDDFISYYLGAVGIGR
jgi:hypothetical protein